MGLKNYVASLLRSQLLRELEELGQTKLCHHQPITCQGKILLLFRPKGWLRESYRHALAALKSIDGVEGGRVTRSGLLLLKVRPDCVRYASTPAELLW